MAGGKDTLTLCEEIRSKYSPCDISDALLTLGVPGAGFLKDIKPIPSRSQGTNRIVAPISTVLFVPKQQRPVFPLWNQSKPWESNIPKGKHWTDCPAPGAIVVLQQPPEQSVALLGDIVATRLKYRGVLGVVIDGRARDVVSCGELCNEGGFQVWSKALSSVGTGMEAKPWAVDVPLTIGGLTVKPGDIVCADEGEGVVCVIPRDKLQQVVELLPVLKRADDGVLADVRKGVDFATALRNHPEHYSNK
ncbi:hypothetical protein LTR62_008818 [Meristemomyces frigidus]|uniref:Uncharacterized protein n=1 Tax=Meristemomyces frigidus TaxID=1508187 RepID=A0AAN7T914_9PEZI|nr:hypothetical protein LTR62_008818 [Meristemomyces frigidus]